MDENISGNVIIREKRLWHREKTIDSQKKGQGQKKVAGKFLR